MELDNSGNLNQPLTELFKPGCKVWLESGGTNFGDGLYHLLLNVNEQGSISQAARTMSMSYRAAWGKIKSAEKNLGFNLVTTQVGGDDGGGTTLTESGSKLIKCYSDFKDKMEKAVREIFEESFGE